MKLQAPSQLWAGMVIRIPNSDGSVDAFSDSLVEDIVNDMVKLARPMMVRGAGEDGFSFHIERYEVGIQSLISRGTEIVQSGERAYVIVTDRMTDRMRVQAFNKINERLSKTPNYNVLGLLTRNSPRASTLAEFKERSLMQKLMRLTFWDCYDICEDLRRLSDHLGSRGDQRA